MIVMGSRFFFTTVIISWLIIFLSAGEWGFASDGEGLAAFQKAAGENSVEGYTAFLGRYQHGIYADQAKQGIEVLRYARARIEGTEEIYCHFLDDFPDGRFAAEIRSELIQIKVVELAIPTMYGVISGIPQEKKEVEQEGHFLVVNRSEIDIEVYGVAETNFQFRLGPGEQEKFSLKGYSTIAFQSSSREFNPECLVTRGEGRNHLIALSFEKKSDHFGRLRVAETYPAQLPNS